MKKIIYLAVALVVVAGCSAQKQVANTPQESEKYTVEEVTLQGIGTGESTDENIARGIAKNVALGDLSVKLEARVRTASSNYQKQVGETSKVLYESLVEVVSKNNLQDVVYTGDITPVNVRNGKYKYQVTATVNQTRLMEKMDQVLERLDATDEERDAFREEMFGS